MAWLAGDGCSSGGDTTGEAATGLRGGDEANPRTWHRWLPWVRLQHTCFYTPSALTTKVTYCFGGMCHPGRVSPGVSPNINTPDDMAENREHTWACKLCSTIPCGLGKHRLGLKCITCSHNSRGVLQRRASEACFR